MVVRMLVLSVWVRVMFRLIRMWLSARSWLFNMKTQGSLLVVKLSSNADNGSNTGTFCLGASNVSSDSYVVIGSESCLKLNNTNCPYRQGKIHYYTPLCVGTLGEDSGATRL
jgi:hypothetical protein